MTVGSLRSGLKRLRGDAQLFAVDMAGRALPVRHVFFDKDWNVIFDVRDLSEFIHDDCAECRRTRRQEGR